MATPLAVPYLDSNRRSLNPFGFLHQPRRRYIGEPRSRTRGPALSTASDAEFGKGWAAHVFPLAVAVVPVRRTAQAQAPYQASPASTELVSRGSNVPASRHNACQDHLWLCLASLFYCRMY